MNKISTLTRFTLLLSAMVLIVPMPNLTLFAQTLIQPDDTVQCANLIYGNNKTSVCFSNQFVKEVNEKTTIRTNEKLASVQLDSQELFEYPFAIMTGEDAFALTGPQQESLRNYLQYGGFVVASSGCSDSKWASSFRTAIKSVFPDKDLTRIEMDHPMFSTFYDIDLLKGGQQLEGLEIDGKIVLVFSEDGLNDSGNVGGDCCCCGGNEIDNALQVNVNLMIYSLTH